MFKKLIIFPFLILLSLKVQSLSNLKNFEGSIKLRKETVYDTSFFTIQVKGNLVRIDEYNSNKSLESIYILNLENEKVLALSPKRKLFYELKPSRAVQISNDENTIIKTDNRMVLYGYSCNQLRVKNISRDTEVVFWVTDFNISFFKSMVKILRKVKPDADIFSYFPDIDGVFPMLTVERTILRKEKMKIVVVGINETLLSENLFKIPTDYQKIEQ